MPVREEPPVPVEIGEEAPDFTLKDQDGNDVELASFRGSHSVVIVFYPFTFTGVCQRTEQKPQKAQFISAR